ncbi:MAG: hypothetical protein JWO59_2470 [Chloroflexi bacterium]|nr:hypothetical protein [Chloroflexota bacterium]
MPNWWSITAGASNLTTCGRDGHKAVTVASRLGTLQLPRQVLLYRGAARDIPGGAALPAHGGMITTRAPQEWACLVAQDVSFASAVRTLVRHGALVRAMEREVVVARAHQAGGSQHRNPETTPNIMHLATGRLGPAHAAVCVIWYRT